MVPNDHDPFYTSLRGSPEIRLHDRVHFAHILEVLFMDIV